MNAALLLQNLTFGYDAAAPPLFTDLEAHFPIGWTGVVGANGAGKSTLLRLAAGIIEPWQGRVSGVGKAVYCSQRTDSIPEGLPRFLAAADGEARRLRGRLGIVSDWPSRWETLSHGERKRAQIALALWREPELLAVDEPTNHLDIFSRSLLASALSEWRGVGILVSHDRELLDGLCRQCLFLEPGVIVMRPGGYTRGAEQAAGERRSTREQALRIRREAARLKREAARRRSRAAGADRRRSKRSLARKDADGREKLDRARITGKDGTDGRLLRQLNGRLRHLELEAQQLHVPKETALKFWLTGSISRRDQVLALAPGNLNLGGRRTLTWPDLTLRPADRVALTGANGAGKSTLLRFLVASSGLDTEKLVYLPQEIALERSQQILASARALPRAELGHLMTVVSGLGSDPEALLQTPVPSPGETRKLLLALGVTRRPHLIVMDEPTNHLDLPSIELLEQALATCPCALLLVSHDLRFLTATTRRRWEIRSLNEEELVLREV